MRNKLFKPHPDNPDDEDSSEGPAPPFAPPPSDTRNMLRPMQGVGPQFAPESGDNEGAQIPIGARHGYQAMPRFTINDGEGLEPTRSVGAAPNSGPTLSRIGTAVQQTRSVGDPGLSNTISQQNASPRQYRIVRKDVPQGAHTSVRIRRTPSSQNGFELQPVRSQLQQSPTSPDFAPSVRQQMMDAQAVNSHLNVPERTSSGRRRSASAPQRADDLTSGLHVSEGGTPLMHSNTANMHAMPPLHEGRSMSRPPVESRDSVEPFPSLDESTDPSNLARPNMFRQASGAAMKLFGGGKGRRAASDADKRPRSSSISSLGSKVMESLNEQLHPHSKDDVYNSDMVDILDVVDPEVATLSTLTNVQNSLFIPNLGPLLNRKPTYNLSRPRGQSALAGSLPPSRPATATVPEPIYPIQEGPPVTSRPQLTHSDTLTSVMSESRFAVLPHGRKLDGWTSAEKEELNDHVRHLLHSRRAAFKRGMKGFGQYVRRPLGFFVTLYATLITLFGLAWVLFLIGWINVGSKRLYVINVIDNVLVALFAIMGDGLAPFRAVDTYHMIFIAHYHHLTWKLRKKQNLPKLEDKNDLPRQRAEQILENWHSDIETQPYVEETGNLAVAAKVAEEERTDRESLSSEGSDGNSDPLKKGESNTNTEGRDVQHEITQDSRGLPVDRDVSETDRRRQEFTVLNPKQQERLQHHQDKFSKSHTFYKPHETATHHAFPLRLLVAVVVLLDCHSLLQIALGTCTWSIPYQTRPFALTTVILCCSITVNITAGVLISVGDHRTRKKDVLERMFRQELTGQAIEKFEKRRQKEKERNAELEKVRMGAETDGRMQTLHEEDEPTIPSLSDDDLRKSQFITASEGMDSKSGLVSHDALKANAVSASSPSGLAKG